MRPLEAVVTARQLSWLIFLFPIFAYFVKFVQKSTAWLKNLIGKRLMLVICSTVSTAVLMSSFATLK